MFVYFCSLLAHYVHISKENNYPSIIFVILPPPFSTLIFAQINKTRWTTLNPSYDLNFPYPLHSIECRDESFTHLMCVSLFTSHSFQVSPSSHVFYCSAKWTLNLFTWHAGNMVDWKVSLNFYISQKIQQQKKSGRRFKNES